MQLNEFLDSKQADKVDLPLLLMTLTHLKELELANEQENDADEYLDAFVALGTTFLAASSLLDVLHFCLNSQLGTYGFRGCCFCHRLRGRRAHLASRTGGAG